METKQLRMVLQMFEAIYMMLGIKLYELQIVFLGVFCLLKGRWEKSKIGSFDESIKDWRLS